MATCSRILAWKIPWTQEPGRLQSMGSQSSDMRRETAKACARMREQAPTHSPPQHTHTHTDFIKIVENCFLFYFSGSVCTELVIILS